MSKKPAPKARSGAPKLPSWWPTGFVPCVAIDPASALGAPFNRVFMLSPTFEGTLAVQRWPNISSMLGVRDRIIPNRQMKNYALEDISLQSALEDLKRQMLSEGATPEAVRLVGEHIPITEEEYKIMANKLSKKTATPKKEKAAPAAKGESKSAKAVKNKTDKPKGEGAGRGPTNFEYKHNVDKDRALEGLRADTWTRRMLEIIMSHTDSEKARKALAADKNYGDNRLDFNWAEKKGHITRV